MLKRVHSLCLPRLALRMDGEGTLGLRRSALFPSAPDVIAGVCMTNACDLNGLSGFGNLVKLRFFNTDEG